MKKQNSAARSRPPGKVASKNAKVRIQKLPTGVRGLDEILGGGIPEYSFNVIAGTPGCGKTTLAHQIVFANATPGKPAFYFTVMGEPAMKMLRYQQQYSFFDESKLGNAIRFINLADTLQEGNLDAVLEEIIKQVTAASPSVVVVDSFRTLGHKTAGGANADEMQLFVQRLAQYLTSWEATTFLVGEYSDEEMRDNPLFTIADGLLWLWQVTERNSVVRKLQIIKLRGQASVPGLHTIRISEDGLQAFSRTLGLVGAKAKTSRRRFLSIGIPELDKMMGGGILEGDSLLVAGPSGTGKSALATQFIAEGLRQGEPGIMAIFEERPSGYIQRAGNFGLHLKEAEDNGKLETLYLRPLDLSVDETMSAILDAIARVGAKRLVIDSLVGFEMALAPGFRADFRESLYRMIGALTGAGVTILSTVEVEDAFTAFSFSHYAISFLTDDIIRMRYVEIDGQLRKVLGAQEEERKRISRDLHDVIAQALTGINLQLAALKLDATTNPTEREQKITRTERLVEQSVNLVHQFARELRPSILDDVGVIPALQTLMKGFKEDTGIQVSLTASAAAEQVHNDVKIVFYRVAQEALTNVARHAQASQVDVSIQKVGGAACMKITDNGKGLPPQASRDGNKNKRLGLLGMKERLEIIGGKFAIESPSGKGTTVTAQVPLSQARFKTKRMKQRHANDRR